MFEKIKHIASSRFVRQFGDIRVVGYWIFAVLVLLLSWNAIGVIQTNFELQKKIANVERQNQIIDLETQNLRLKNEYFKTEDFLELSARRLFGKAAPGERVYVIPDEVALSYAPPEPKPKTSEQSKDKSTGQQNLEAWLNWFLHR
jgi:cell division protein FtsB